MFQILISNKLLLTILIAINIIFVPFNVTAIVKPTEDFFVNDYANILSEGTKEYIIEKSLELESLDGTQIVVVTVDSLEGKTIETYANELYRSFEIGDSDQNNGLLLLLALEERTFRVEVGYGLEGILPDGKTGRFQDNYMIPYFREDLWDDGIINGYNAFFDEIVTLNNLDIIYDEPSEFVPAENEIEEVEDSFYIALFGTFIVSLVLGIKTGKEQSKKQRAYYKNYFKTMNPYLEKMLAKEPVNSDYVNVKANKGKITIYIIMFALIGLVLACYYATAISLFINLFTFYIAFIFQFPSNRLPSSTDDTKTTSTRYTSSGSSRSASGRRGGGGSSGGGGSTRRF